jgi:hypothetical protein
MDGRSHYTDPISIMAGYLVVVKKKEEAFQNFEMPPSLN